MARTATINYRRVTISLPQRVVNELREKTENNKMSSYIAGLIEKDLAGKASIEKEVDKFYDSLASFSKEITKNFKDKRSAVEILREIRYGKDA